MNQITEQVLESAMSLTQLERGFLVAHLIESLEQSDTGDHSAAWSAEIQKRVTELDSGTITTISEEDALRMIRGGNGNQTD